MVIYFLLFSIKRILSCIYIMASDLKHIFNNLKKELDKKLIETLLRDNYINFNRVEIYRNFIRVLSNNIYSTYLGKEYISSEEDILGHYNWCFNDVCNKFKLMGVDFNNNIEVRDYFMDYYRFGLYNAENGKEYPEKNVAVYFNSIFELVEPKPMMEMLAYIDIYNMFNNTFTNSNKNK